MILQFGLVQESFIDLIIWIQLSLKVIVNLIKLIIILVKSLEVLIRSTEHH